MSAYIVFHSDVPSFDANGEANLNAVSPVFQFNINQGTTGPTVITVQKNETRKIKVSAAAGYRILSGSFQIDYEQMEHKQCTVDEFVNQTLISGPHIDDDAGTTASFAIATQGDFVGVLNLRFLINFAAAEP